MKSERELGVGVSGQIPEGRWSNMQEQIKHKGNGQFWGESEQQGCLVSWIKRKPRLK